MDHTFDWQSNVHLMLLRVVILSTISENFANFWCSEKRSYFAAEAWTRMKAQEETCRRIQTPNTTRFSYQISISAGNVLVEILYPRISYPNITLVQKVCTYIQIMSETDVFT
jgi:hypothetical protein